ncbi:MAG: SinI family restriction endonuclease [Candidatus Tokpelaia sp.]|nr:MAG: SinI family restriction endonuclease [Candidatus Tokpelaia sp.]
MTHNDNINSTLMLIREQQPQSESPFITITEFLKDNPEFAPVIRNQNFGTEEYNRSLAQRFINGRKLRAPTPPETISDEMVGFIIHEYFGIPNAELSEAKKLHNLSMAAENLIGELLERYIASIVEKHGWIWCSGSVVKAADFIYKDAGGQWQALQVKNRDNSENSSSSAIREGTTITKWFRSFSKKQGDNWDNFPLQITGTVRSEVKFRGDGIKGVVSTRTDTVLSEVDFREYVAAYLQQLKKAA